MKTMARKATRTTGTTNVTTTAATHSQRLLGWTFQRGTRLLSCEVLADADGTFSVVTLANDSTHPLMHERLAAGVAAFQRHATVALQLRQQGWTVVAYAPLPSPRTPATAARRVAA